MNELRKELGLLELSLYGIGVILGAGIYALIGASAGVAGNLVWAAFALSAVLAAFTGLSYAELSSMYPKTAAEYNYSLKAFKNKTLSFVIGWLMILASLSAAVTVSFGFAGYATSFVNASELVIASALLVGLSAINYLGIKTSTKFNIVATLIETGGLILVILVGAFVFSQSGLQVDLFETPGNADALTVVIAATTLIFFAYLGFEDIVNMAEETKNAKKLVPKALIISLVVSTILYILVSISAVNTIGWQALSESNAPLTSVVASVIPQTGSLFSLVALFATANTALVLLIVASRIVFGMSKLKALPPILSKLSQKSTPHYAISVMLLLGLALLFTGTLKSIALITDFTLFLVYASVNASLIWLRFSDPSAKREFKVPGSIGKLPILATLGFLSSIAMLFYFERTVLTSIAVLIFIGLALHWQWSKMRK